MTKVISIGKVNIGGDNKVAIQSMTNIPVTDIDSTVDQVRQLVSCGCDIVRVAIPDMDSAVALTAIKSQLINVPIVADIHFDYRLAIASIENGADKIRINPGNIGASNIEKIVDCAKYHNIPIRIGVNSGSLDKDMLAKYNGDKVLASVNSIEQYIRQIEQFGYDNMVLSIKSSSVLETVASNRLLSQQFHYPLHLGVTEAGPKYIGAQKGAMGIGSLLLDGIGNTIRVSLTAPPVEEVAVAHNILQYAGLTKGMQFVSCPKCGRCSYDIESVANTIYSHISHWDIPVKVAVMGCEVNGPGECADADIGMAGGRGKVAFFKHGKVYKVVSGQDAVKEFLAELEEFYEYFTSHNN